jgi:cytosine/adenosine deaminase-related metal-dependent hydrolase
LPHERRTTPTTEPFDLVITGAELIATMDATRSEVRGGWIAVRDGRIAAMGAAGTEPEATDSLKANGCLVTPGLVNTHHHIYQNLTRSFAPALNGDLFDWLRTL